MEKVDSNSIQIKLPRVIKDAYIKQNSLYGYFVQSKLPFMQFRTVKCQFISKLTLNSGEKSRFYTRIFIEYKISESCNKIA